MRNLVQRMNTKTRELDGFEAVPIPAKQDERIPKRSAARGPLSQIAEFYEHHFVKTLHQTGSLKADWDFYLRGTVQDLQLARGFHDDCDALQIECLAMHQRFAGELLVQPLVIPKEMKTTNQIEDEQLANMHKGVLKHFLDSYKALPKWMIESGCPGYEILRAEYMNAEKEKLEKERGAIERSFFVDG